MSQSSLALTVIVAACIVLSVLLGRRSAVEHKQKQIEQRAKRLGREFAWDQQSEPQK